MLLPRRLLAGCIASVAMACLPPAAVAATPSEATYQVTIRAEMKERWQFREFYSAECAVNGSMGTCTRERKGSGTASIDLKTPRPVRALVMRGFGGRGPMIDVGTGEGMRTTGPYLRTGSDVEEYSGAWDAANPDVAQPVTGCGNRSIDVHFSFGWKARNVLLPTALVDDLRAECPDGPPELEWQGGETPDLMAVVAQVAQSKFLRSKQFTVRGNRSWSASVPPLNRTDPRDTYIKNGEKTVSWAWEATFRMVKAKKRRR